MHLERQNATSALCSVNRSISVDNYEKQTPLFDKEMCQNTKDVEESRETPVILKFQSRRLKKNKNQNMLLV